MQLIDSKNNVIDINCSEIFDDIVVTDISLVIPIICLSKLEQINIFNSFLKNREDFGESDADDISDLNLLLNIFNIHDITYSYISDYILGNEEIEVIKNLIETNEKNIEFPKVIFNKIEKVINF